MRSIPKRLTDKKPSTAVKYKCLYWWYEDGLLPDGLIESSATKRAMIFENQQCLKIWESFVKASSGRRT